MSETRFTGTVDHLGVKCDDLQTAIETYKSMGFVVETVYPDWAMVRDGNGFGIALLPPDSKHPPHLGIRVETREQLEAAAAREDKPIKPHRDGTSSFYTKGLTGQVIEVIHYPPDYNPGGYAD